MGATDKLIYLVVSLLIAITVASFAIGLSDDVVSTMSTIGEETTKSHESDVTIQHLSLNETSMNVFVKNTGHQNLPIDSTIFVNEVEKEVMNKSLVDSSDNVWQRGETLRLTVSHSLESGPVTVQYVNSNPNYGQDSMNVYLDDNASWADSDGDGLTNLQDDCPWTAEDMDGDSDMDGCPE